MFRLLNCFIEFMDMKFPVNETIFVRESAAKNVEILYKLSFRVYSCVFTIVKKFKKNLLNF